MPTLSKRITNLRITLYDLRNQLAARGKIISIQTIKQARYHPDMVKPETLSAIIACIDELEQGQVLPIDEECTKRIKREFRSAISVSDNLPVCGYSDVSHVLHWADKSRVTTDEQTAERLNEFFAYCSECGIVPTFESMCLALGISRQAFSEWSNRGGTRGDLLKKAKQSMAAISATMAACRIIPETVYIWQGKNYYGMTNETVPIVSRKVEMQAQTLDEVERKYK